MLLFTYDGRPTTADAVGFNDTPHYLVHNGTVQRRCGERGGRTQWATVARGEDIPQPVLMAAYATYELPYDAVTWDDVF